MAQEKYEVKWEMKELLTNVRSNLTVKDSSYTSRKMWELLMTFARDIFLPCVILNHSILLAFNESICSCLNINRSAVTINRRKVRRGYHRSSNEYFVLVWPNFYFMELPLQSVNNNIQLLWMDISTFMINIIIIKVILKLFTLIELLLLFIQGGGQKESGILEEGREGGGAIIWWA